MRFCESAIPLLMVVKTWGMSSAFGVVRQVMRTRQWKPLRLWPDIQALRFVNSDLNYLV
jgi:hypothetical protein